MRRAANIYRRFLASRRGVAAIEFAAVLPVLAIMLLGSFDAARAIAIYMKVRAATYTVAAIANQYTSIASSDMTTIVGAASKVIAPYPTTPVVVTLSQIRLDSKGNGTVAWSYSLNGAARTAGSSIAVPSTLATPNTYLIFGEVTYTYTPLFGFFGSGAINLADNLYVTPRTTTCIPYVPATGTNCY